MTTQETAQSDGSAVIQPPQRHLPGGGIFRFPEGMTEAEADALFAEMKFTELPRPMSWLDREPANIHEALARAMVEMPAIGKDSNAAPEQGAYKYRGIEAITAHAQSVLGRLGVIAYPVIMGDPQVENVQVGSKPWTKTTMRIRYRFVHGPSGTRITVGGKKGFVAIGLDNSDKGANKCMTQAYKYALLQTLMIGDKNDDADSGSPAADAPPKEAWEHFGYQDQADYEKVHEQVSAAWSVLDEDQITEVRIWLAAQEPPITRKWPLPADVADQLFDRMKALVAHAAAEQPDELPPPEPQNAGEGTPGSPESDQDAGAQQPPPEEPPGAPAKARAPSAADLERAGVTQEDIDEAIEKVKGLDAGGITTLLTELNLATNGTAPERKHRLASVLALEIAKARPAVEPTPITGEARLCDKPIGENGCSLPPGHDGECEEAF